eukprot:2843822-Rhodomonas_salina.1
MPKCGAWLDGSFSATQEEFSSESVAHSLRLVRGAEVMWEGQTQGLGTASAARHLTERESRGVHKCHLGSPWTPVSLSLRRWLIGCRTEPISRRCVFGFRFQDPAPLQSHTPDSLKRQPRLCHAASSTSASVTAQRQHGTRRRVDGEGMEERVAGADSHSPKNMTPSTWISHDCAPA